MDASLLTPIITGLVGAYTAYTQYQAAVTTATTRQAPPPPKPVEAAQGEQAALLVQAAVAQHGDTKAQTTLALFDDDPETYQEAVQRILVNLATQKPEFAQALQAAAEQAGLVRRDAGGQVTIDGNVYGAVVQDNSGSITSTYTFGRRDEAQR